MVNKVSLENCRFEKSPLKFEAGTINYQGAIGLATAIDYLQRLDREEIGRYEAQLVQQIAKTLVGIDGVSIVGDPKQRAGVVSFTMEGFHPYDIATLLDKLGIAVRLGHHCAQPLLAHYHLNGAVRVSPAFYNTSGEIDRLAQGLRKIQSLCEKRGTR